VFKIIKDTRRKDISREFIQKQYQLVKFHDRVRRMADTWEYANVPIPKTRIDSALTIDGRSDDWCDSGLLLESNRAVQFHRDYELTLMGPWSAELDQVVRIASLPQHFKKPHFSLADLAEASKLPTYRVTKLVSKGTDLQVRELINHFRVRHYEQLQRAQPLERKKELLAQSGFNSYAAYYAARKVKKSV
jgi:hypothetical protein